MDCGNRPTLEPRWSFKGAKVHAHQTPCYSHGAGCDACWDQVEAGKESTARRHSRRESESPQSDNALGGFPNRLPRHPRLTITTVTTIHLALPELNTFTNGCIGGNIDRCSGTTPRQPLSADKEHTLARPSESMSSIPPHSTNQLPRVAPSSESNALQNRNALR